MFVDEGAESQAVPEGRGHVGDGHVPVALDLDPAPLLQRLHGGHPEAPESELKRVGAAGGSASFRLPPHTHTRASTHAHTHTPCWKLTAAETTECVCVCVCGRSPDTLRVCHLFSHGKSDVTPAEGRLLRVMGGVHHKECVYKMLKLYKTRNYAVTSFTPV